MNDRKVPSELQEAEMLAANEPSKAPTKGIIVATELGFTLAVATCVCGFIGYWVGQNVIKNSAAAFFLLVGGIIVGFAFGIYRMVQVSERMSAASKQSSKDKS